MAMHPFYGPSDRLLSGRESRGAGLASMAAYLAFWAFALVVAKHELDARFPRVGGKSDQGDRARAILRERFARGDIDEAQFRAMTDVLDEAAGRSA